MTHRTSGYAHTLRLFWPATPKDPATISEASDGMQQVAQLARSLGATVIADAQKWGSTTEPLAPRITLGLRPAEPTAADVRGLLAPPADAAE